MGGVGGGSVRIARHAGPTRVWRAGLVAAAILAIAAPHFDAVLAVSITKGHEHHAVLFSKWNSFSRIGVYDQPYGAWSLSERYTGPLPDTPSDGYRLGGRHPDLRFRGDLREVKDLQYELTAIGYRLTATRRNAAVAVQCARHRPGGGRDLLSALVFGAARVDGVEINPIIVNDVMRGAFREYSGGVYEQPGGPHPRRGRPQLRAAITEQYDVIQASLVDTWAATAAGAYTLTENSL